MSNTKFTKIIEDFDCEHCGAHVTGNGYTNHCPQCLHSKHVDIFPGDRAESCGGIMKPAEVLGVSDSYILVHRCVLCGYTKQNKMSLDDDMSVAIELAQEKARTPQS